MKGFNNWPNRFKNWLFGKTGRKQLKAERLKLKANTAARCKPGKPVTGNW
jgi:hypothetical protein